MSTKPCCCLESVSSLLLTSPVVHWHASLQLTLIVERPERHPYTNQPTYSHLCPNTNIMTAGQSPSHSNTPLARQNLPTRQQVLLSLASMNLLPGFGASAQIIQHPSSAPRGPQTYFSSIGPRLPPILPTMDEVRARASQIASQQSPPPTGQEVSAPLPQVQPPQLTGEALASAIGRFRPLITPAVTRNPFARKPPATVQQAEPEAPTEMNGDSGEQQQDTPQMTWVRNLPGGQTVSIAAGPRREDEPAPISWLKY